MNLVIHVPAVNLQQALPPKNKNKNIFNATRISEYWLKKEKIEWFKKVNENDDDAEKHFLLSLLPQMKNLAPSKLRSVKMKFMATLHEATYGDETQQIM